MNCVLDLSGEVLINFDFFTLHCFKKLGLEMIVMMPIGLLRLERLINVRLLFEDHHFARGRDS